MLGLKKRKEKFFQNKDMTFLEHLEEMRWVIIKCIAVLFLMIFIVGIGYNHFFDLLQYPLHMAEKMLDHKIPLRVGSIMSPIFIMVYVVLSGGIALALPFMLVFIAGFVAPGLTKDEKRLLLPGAFTGALLFIVGVSFAFFIIMPAGIYFSSLLSASMNLDTLYDWENYYSFIIWVTLSIGLAFELPLLEVILLYLGVLNPDFLRKNRRMVILILFIVAAVITPPDVFTQIALVVPLYLMYEGALFIGTRLRKRKLAAEAERERKEAEQEAKERKEYAEEIIEKRRLEMAEEERLRNEEAQKKAADPNALPDDYDPNKPDENDYGYADYEAEYYRDEYDAELEELERYDAIPEYDFSPDWSLNEPNLDIFAPDWHLNDSSKEEGGKSGEEDKEKPSATDKESDSAEKASQKAEAEKLENGAS